MFGNKKRIDEIENKVNELYNRPTNENTQFTSSDDLSKNAEYRKRLSDLEKQVWTLTNPSKYECGDTVNLSRCGLVSCKVVKKKPCLDIITNEYHWGYLLTHNDGLLDSMGRGIAVEDGDENYRLEYNLYSPVDAQWMPLKPIPKLDGDTAKTIKLMSKESKKSKKGKKKLLKG